MSIQQVLIDEVTRQPESVLREVLHFLNSMKTFDDPEADKGIRPGFGSVPGIKLADDFDAPLEEFADYRP